MEIVANRARAVLTQDIGDRDLLSRRFDEITDKRNSPVHEKIGVTITRRDNEFLRSVFYEFIPFIVVNRNWCPEDIETWLDNASKPELNLDDKLHRLEDEAEEKQNQGRDNSEDSSVKAKEPVIYGQSILDTEI